MGYFLECVLNYHTVTDLAALTTHDTPKNWLDGEDEKIATCQFW